MRSCYPVTAVQPLVKGALAVAVLAAASALTGTAARPTTAPPREAASSSDELMKMPCGAREIPEGEACIPVPAPTGSSGARDPAPGDENDDDVARRDEAPARLPRRPDRPANLKTLALPIDGDPPLLDVAGVERDSDDRSVLRLGAPRGAPAHAIALEGQVGPLEILAVERLAGRGLVVAALAHLGGVPDDQAAHLVLFGSLDGAGPGLEHGSKLEGGAVVGFAGDSASPGESCLRFEVRRVRPGTDPRTTPLAKLVGDAESVATDARNVLPVAHK